MATTVIIYLILHSGRWEFLAIDPAPVTPGFCELTRAAVDRVYTGTDGNVRIVCGEAGTDA
jgi:hypothetical protein